MLCVSRFFVCTRDIINSIYLVFMRQNSSEEVHNATEPDTCASRVVENSHTAHYNNKKNLMMKYCTSASFDNSVGIGYPVINLYYLWHIQHFTSVLHLITNPTCVSATVCRDYLHCRHTAKMLDFRAWITFWPAYVFNA